MATIKVTMVANGDFQLRQIQSKAKESTVGTIHTVNKATLVVFFGWLYAKPGALEKYFNLYHERGFDVLFVPGHLKQLCWPSFSFKLSKTVLDYLCKQTGNYSYFLIHAMSIGAYNYTSCLITAQENSQIYANFWNKLGGIIFDSLTIGSTERMRLGVGIGISKNKIIQHIIPSILSVYFLLTWKNTVALFEQMVNKFKEQPAKVPTLFIYSRDDPMCDADDIDELVKTWKRKWTFPVMTECWDTSVHAGHFLMYRDDYLKVFEKFLQIFENNYGKQETLKLVLESNIATNKKAKL